MLRVKIHFTMKQYAHIFRIRKWDGSLVLKIRVVPSILLYLELCLAPVWRYPKRDICWCSYRTTYGLLPFGIWLSIDQTLSPKNRCHIPRSLSLITSSAFVLPLHSLLLSSVFLTISKVINPGTISVLNCFLLPSRTLWSRVSLHSQRYFFKPLLHLEALWLKLSFLLLERSRGKLFGKKRDLV